MSGGNVGGARRVLGVWNATRQLATLWGVRASRRRSGRRLPLTLEQALALPDEDPGRRGRG